MLDPTLRNRRIVQEARDPETAVILLDIVLGFGAHPDPAGAAVEAIREAQSHLAEEGRTVLFVAHVCGTEGDPQNLRAQGGSSGSRRDRPADQCRSITPGRLHSGLEGPRYGNPRSLWAADPSHQRWP